MLAGLKLCWSPPSLPARMASRCADNCDSLHISMVHHGPGPKVCMLHSQTGMLALALYGTLLCTRGVLHQGSRHSLVRSSGGVCCCSGKIRRARSGEAEGEDAVREGQRQVDAPHPLGASQRLRAGPQPPRICWR